MNSFVNGFMKSSVDGARRRAGVSIVLAVALLPVLTAVAAAQVRADDLNDRPGIDPQPKPTVDIEYILGRAHIRRGGTGTVVFSVRTAVPLRSLAVAIDFDETRLQARNVSRMDVEDASPVLADALARTIQNNFDRSPGNQINEGWIAVKLDSGDDRRALIEPSDVPIPVLRIEFRALATADFGFTPLIFREVQSEPVEPPDIAEVFDNRVEEASPDGGQVNAFGLGDENFREGGIEIIGEVGFFMRGDANFDLERNITDPTVTLRFLFMNGPPLLCDDSGDSNDDGQLDVSDAVHTLNRLFISSDPFPAPHDWGVDPTPDDLGCDIYTS